MIIINTGIKAILASVILFGKLNIKPLQYMYSDVKKSHLNRSDDFSPFIFHLDCDGLRHHIMRIEFIGQNLSVDFNFQVRGIARADFNLLLIRDVFFKGFAFCSVPSFKEPPLSSRTRIHALSEAISSSLYLSAPETLYEEAEPSVPAALISVFSLLSSFFFCSDAFVSFLSFCCQIALRHLYCRRFSAQNP